MLGPPDLDSIDNMLGDGLRMLLSTLSQILGSVILIAIVQPCEFPPFFRSSAGTSTTLTTPSTNSQTSSLPASWSSTSSSRLRSSTGRRLESSSESTRSCDLRSVSSTRLLSSPSFFYADSCPIFFARRRPLWRVAGGFVDHPSLRRGQPFPQREHATDRSRE